MAKSFIYRYRIPWICNNEETEYFAHLGRYDIRAKKIGSRQWWWQVSFDKEPIATKLEEHAPSRSRAMALAEGTYLGHMAAIESYEKIHTDLIIKKLTGNENLHFQH